MSGPNILNPYWNKSKQERISKNKIHKEGIVGCRFGVDCHYPKKECNFGHRRSFWSQRGPRQSRNRFSGTVMDDRTYIIASQQARTREMKKNRELH